MKTLTKSISGWGRNPVQACKLMRPEKYADLKAHTASCIARGQGKSYGDASLNEDHLVILTERLNRLISFDQKQGIITAEAGVTLKEILDVVVPQNWFLPVTPGTQFVSLGGCVAADVHGKNHHKVGSFGEHIMSLTLILADGSSLHCSPTKHSDIFWATVGGMGLTGIIGEVTLQLIPIKNAFMSVTHHEVNTLEHMCHSFNQSRYDDDYTVMWLDTEKDHGIVMAAHASDIEGKAYKAKAKKLNFNMPRLMFNNPAIKLFNRLYFYKNAHKTNFISHYKPYFYPLDNIQDWNKLYGKKGFVQYQCVLPTVSALKGIQEILKTMKKNNAVSFLSVLKKLGKPSGGLLSFPMEGLTLAMDIKFENTKTLDLLKEFDAIVLAHQGRVYLAKDACLSPESFRAMYPQYERFREIKHKLDPQNIFSSSLSRRLKIGNA